MANQPTLLKLPAELRLHIYKYISPVISGSPISSFRDIFLSCKQLYNEASTEVLKNGRKAIAALEGELQSSYGNVNVSAPQRLHDLISLPVTLPPVVGGQLIMESFLDDILQQILVFHINHMTIHGYIGYGGNTYLELRMGMKIEEAVDGRVSISLNYRCGAGASRVFIFRRIKDFIARNFSEVCKVRENRRILGYSTCEWTALNNHNATTK
jgi:hypothetical protein